MSRLGIFHEADETEKGKADGDELPQFSFSKLYRCFSISAMIKNALSLNPVRKTDANFFIFSWYEGYKYSILFVLNPPGRYFLKFVKQIRI